MTIPLIVRQFVPSLANRRTESTNRSLLNGRRRDRPSFRPLAAAVLIVGLTTAGPVQGRSTDSYQQSITEAGHRFGIPAHWLRAVMVAESAADPQALSHKGAMGLMQIMPETWDELRARHGLGSDPFVPADNILAGTAYLRQMLDRYGSVALMLAAYNAGLGRVDDHLATGRALPNETIDYVAKLLPKLTAAHQGSAPALLEHGLPDPFASTLFVTTGRGFVAGLERSTDRFLRSGTAVPPGVSAQSTPNGTTSDHPLFVQPNTHQKP